MLFQESNWIRSLSHDFSMVLNEMKSVKSKSGLSSGIDRGPSTASNVDSNIARFSHHVDDNNIGCIWQDDVILADGSRRCSMRHPKYGPRHLYFPIISESSVVANTYTDAVQS